jgi:hypothetical protein
MAGSSHLAGKLLQTVSAGEPNNVDVIYGFEIGDRKVDLAQEETNRKESEKERFLNNIPQCVILPACRVGEIEFSILPANCFKQFPLESQTTLMLFMASRSVIARSDLVVVMMVDWSALTGEIQMAGSSPSPPLASVSVYVPELLLRQWKVCRTQRMQM